MTYYEKIKKKLHHHPKKWLITGVAGFIGSSLLEELLLANQKVVGVDNLSNSNTSNLTKLKKKYKDLYIKNFKFFQLDLKNLNVCLKVTKNIDYVLHQAALGSVPRSIKQPINSHNNNVNTFLNMMFASKKNKIKSFVYASSSSVYGDDKSLPKKESTTGQPLSTYALTKLINEQYAKIFYKNYGFSSIGLRYFNVFGENQTSNSIYAAVIPIWINAIKKNKSLKIYGDGKTSRDFCYIKNAIQANILAALKKNINGSKVYNVSIGDSISLNKAFSIIKEEFRKIGISYNQKPNYMNFRPGDIRNSKADISNTKKELKYRPQYNFTNGIRKLIENLR